jgi:hypothetical protein
MSVSTLIIGSGAAMPVSVVNFCMSDFLQEGGIPRPFRSLPQRIGA